MPSSSTQSAFGLPSAVVCSMSMCESPRPWKKMIAEAGSGTPSLR